MVYLFCADTQKHDNNKKEKKRHIFIPDTDSLLYLKYLIPNTEYSIPA